ncbi:hypothetical protein EIP91_001124 [Steccherinum ochraceum]|uniref:NudC domain-containing protein 1 n=1 Tax=Steccherinum ochraceum TaxID=92696 RepID=A0A4R0RV73_9APHY|nr:hypothetical protein EIP91_001124 [Steccherinum ochraceum]
MFEPTRSLLNPKFEGYKLDALDQDKLISRFPLQHALSQTTLSGRVPLSFQEIQTSGQDLPQREYPSAVFLDEETLVVSDGYGSAYLLKLAQSGPAQLINTFELVIPDLYESARPNGPFRIHSATHGTGESAVVILSAKYYPVQGADDTIKPKRNTLSSVKFDIWAVRIRLDAVSQDQPLPFDIIWHRRGDDVPQSVVHDPSRNAVMLLSSCLYKSLRAPTPVTYEPTNDEIAPIPRAGENLDADGVSAQLATAPPPPYSWTQTSDSVTVAFPLPSSTPKSAIKVTFSARTLTVIVSAESPSPSVPIPKYTAKQLWDGIQPSTSFWTWDKEDSRSYGILTLHLDKQHEGTRWVQVFASAGAKSSSAMPSSPEDIEVPETLDPSELYNIRENMEKFTEALQNGQGAMPSLAEGEMDEEIDSEMGKWSFLTWVNDDGTEPSWASDRGIDSPLSILSTPMPGLATPQPTIVTKNGLDGVLFCLQSAVSVIDAPEWKHTSTFSALSFVLASKRDTRFVHHVSSKAVLAFDSGSQGNVYVYRNTAGVHDQYAKQAVLKIASGMAGSLLGVGILTTTEKRHLILGLCEGELVVAHDVL